MLANLLPPLEYLRECFDLSQDSVTGLFWKTRPRHHFPTSHGWNNTNSKRAGKVAGSFKDNKRGHQYFQLRINDIHYLVHRIVYSLAYETELTPEIQIDHRDGNGLNNHPSNLRLALNKQNTRNTKLRKNNKSGTKGVCWDKSKGMWIVQIRVDGINHRGCFVEHQAACEYAAAMRPALHGEFTNHGT